MFEKIYHAYKAEWTKIKKEQKNDSKMSGEIFESIIYFLNRVKAAISASTRPKIFSIILITYAILTLICIVLTICFLFRLPIAENVTGTYLGLTVMDYIVVWFASKTMPTSLEITLNDTQIEDYKRVLMDQRKDFEKQVVKPLKKAFEMFDLDAMHSINWALEEWNELYGKYTNTKKSFWNSSYIISITAFFGGKIYEKMFGATDIINDLLLFLGIMILCFSINLVKREFLDKINENSKCLNDMREGLVYYKHFRYANTFDE